MRSQCASDYEPHARFCGEKVGEEEIKIGSKNWELRGLNVSDLKYTGEIVGGGGRL